MSMIMLHDMFWWAVANNYCLFYIRVSHYKLFREKALSNILSY